MVEKMPLNKDERQLLGMLRQRQAHLRARILQRRATGASASFDVTEANALEWAIREIGKTRDILPAAPPTGAAYEEKRRRDTRLAMRQKIEESLDEKLEQIDAEIINRRKSS